MRKLRLVCVVLSVFAYGSVQSGAVVKPGPYTPVPLIVAVNACNVLNTPEICGDGFGLASPSDDSVYTDGEDGVSAKIDQYGNVIIDFQTTRAKIRGLIYKYGSTTPAPPGAGSNHYFSTIGGALQPMADGDKIPVRSCPLYDDDSGQPQYRHSFDRDCQAGRGGDPLDVTRMSASRWVVEPALPAEAMVFSITTKGRAQVQQFGNISLPFRMTLTAKP